MLSNYSLTLFKSLNKHKWKYYINVQKKLKKITKKIRIVIIADMSCIFNVFFYKILIFLLLIFFIKIMDVCILFIVFH
jgi:hypothetical protein